MESSYVTGFIVGILFGSFLNTATTFVLVFLFFIVNNRPLPRVFGELRPQEILGAILLQVSLYVKSLVELHKIKDKKGDRKGDGNENMIENRLEDIKQITTENIKLLPNKQKRILVKGVEVT